MPFGASTDFAIDKAAGTPCSNLKRDYHRGNPLPAARARLPEVQPQVNAATGDMAARLPAARQRPTHWG